MIYFPAHLGCWQNLVPCNYRIEVLISLMIVSWGPFSSSTIACLLTILSLPLLRAHLIRMGVHIDNSSLQLKICKFNQICIVSADAESSNIFTGSRNEDVEVFGKPLFCLHIKTIHNQPSHQLTANSSQVDPGHMHCTLNPQNFKTNTCWFKPINFGVVYETERANWCNGQAYTSLKIFFLRFYF